MNKIEVAVIDEGNDPGGMMKFLARLTQRGHAIKSMADLLELKKKSANPTATYIETMMRLGNHGTIKRFSPITVAIVGASRRFLAQARTNQVGFNYVSASLQYSDYSSDAAFVVPYAIIEADKNYYDAYGDVKRMYSGMYLEQCASAMSIYKALAEETDNDTAGYVAPQGLRNILVMQANYESWLHFLRLRTCNRNTNETQYVALRIWEELLKTTDGEAFFRYAGPDCMYGACKEGKMCCGKPMTKYTKEHSDKSIPRRIIEQQWPLLEM